MKNRRIPVSHLFPSGGIVMVEKTRTDTRTPPVAPNFLIQVALSKVPDCVTMAVPMPNWVLPTGKYPSFGSRP